MLTQIKPAVAKVLTPVGTGLARMGVTPNMITLVGVVGVAVCSLTFYPHGYFFWGSLAITAFVLSDMLDGAVARARGGGSVWGSFFDSTLDRYADAAVFAGLALWYAGRGDDVFMVGLCIYVLIFAQGISYARARAEGLGLQATVGFAERTERLIVILAGVGLSEAFHLPWLKEAALWVLAVACTITVVQRILFVRGQALAGEGHLTSATWSGPTNPHLRAHDARTEPGGPGRTPTDPDAGRGPGVNPAGSVGQPTGRRSAGRAG